MWMDWIRYAVTEFLFPPGWYNRNVYPKGFVADNAQSKVLAMARIRQLRVQPSMFYCPFFEFQVWKLWCTVIYKKDFSRKWLLHRIMCRVAHVYELTCIMGVFPGHWSGYLKPWFDNVAPHSLSAHRLITLECGPVPPWVKIEVPQSRHFYSLGVLPRWTDRLWRAQ